MGESLVLKKGSNADLSFITATSSDILSGKISCDKDMNPVNGIYIPKTINRYEKIVWTYPYKMDVGINLAATKITNLAQIQSISIINNKLISIGSTTGILSLYYDNISKSSSIVGVVNNYSQFSNRNIVTLSLTNSNQVLTITLPSSAYNAVEMFFPSGSSEYLNYKVSILYTN